MNPRIVRLCLADELEALGLSDREWIVLEGRLGPGKPVTLRELAEALDVSRERVRQLQKSAMGRVVRFLPLLMRACNTLENQGTLLWDPFSAQASLDRAVASCQRLFVRAGWARPTKVDILRLFTVVRGAVESGAREVVRTWPRASYAMCGLQHVITKHARAANEALRRERELEDQRQVWSYQRLVVTVLKEAESPLHWREIASRAECLGHRKEFNASSLFNTLYLNPDTFARVGQGTYGLVEDGYHRVENYDDIIAEVLKAAKKPLSYGELLQEVNTIRQIKPASLQMYLDTHVRFYCSLEGTYGLRAWLPPPQKQTLRTARWQVEARDSFERVSRERARGSDIDGIVAQDREQDQIDI